MFEHADYLLLYVIAHAAILERGDRRFAKHPLTSLLVGTFIDCLCLSNFYSVWVAVGSMLPSHVGLFIPRFLDSVPQKFFTSFILFLFSNSWTYWGSRCSLFLSLLLFTIVSFFFSLSVCSACAQQVRWVYGTSQLFLVTRWQREYSSSKSNGEAQGSFLMQTMYTTWKQLGLFARGMCFPNVEMPLWCNWTESLRQSREDNAVASKAT